MVQMAMTLVSVEQYFCLNQHIGEILGIHACDNNRFLARVDADAYKFKLAPWPEKKYGAALYIVGAVKLVDGSRQADEGRGTSAPKSAVVTVQMGEKA